MFSVRHVWNTLYDFRKNRHTATSDVLSTSSVVCFVCCGPSRLLWLEMMQWKSYWLKTNSVSWKTLKCAVRLMGLLMKLCFSKKYSPFKWHIKDSYEQLSDRADMTDMILRYFFSLWRKGVPIFMNVYKVTIFLSAEHESLFSWICWYRLSWLIDPLVAWGLCKLESMDPITALKYQ